MSRFDDDDPRIPRGRSFNVGVFPCDERNTRFNAYVRDYNPQWLGCCQYKIWAINGTEAKRLAIAEHKENCK